MKLKYFILLILLILSSSEIIRDEFLVHRLRFLDENSNLSLNTTVSSGSEVNNNSTSKNLNTTISHNTSASNGTNTNSQNQNESNNNSNSPSQLENLVDSSSNLMNHAKCFWLEKNSFSVYDLSGLKRNSDKQ